MSLSFLLCKRKIQLSVISKLIFEEIKESHV